MLLHILAIYTLGAIIVLMWFLSEYKYLHTLHVMRPRKQAFAIGCTILASWIIIVAAIIDLMRYKNNKTKK